MKLILIGLTIIVFGIGGVAAANGDDPVFANKVAAACKDKKPGEIVKIDDKDMKCPRPGSKDGKK